MFGLFFLIILYLRNSESSPDTHVHVYIPPEQGGQVEIEEKAIGCHGLAIFYVFFLENASQSSSANSLWSSYFYVYQKDQPLILEEIKYMKLDLITAKTKQIQKQFLEQLKHQKVQKQWSR